MRFILIVFLIVLTSCTLKKKRSDIADSVSDAKTFMNGVDSNYYNQMVGTPFNVVFHHNGQPIENYFKVLKETGVNTIRMRLFIDNKDGLSDLDYVTKIAQHANREGLKLYLVLFLSDDWSDINKQPASKRWADLYPDLDRMTLKISEYTSNIARHFKKLGIPIALYSIGNEIDFGISGFYPEAAADGQDNNEQHSKDKMFFSEISYIVKAGQSGVKSVDKDAKFIHHLSYIRPEFLSSHFSYMIKNGVQIDYLGVSMYPAAWLLSTEEFKKIVDDLFSEFSIPVIIPEYGYIAKKYENESAIRDDARRWFKNHKIFGGFFSDEQIESHSESVVKNISIYNKTIEGYPGTNAGQANYIAEMLEWGKNSKSVAGMFYWSPEGVLLEPYYSSLSLFDSNHHSRPGFGALSKGSR